MLSIRTTFVELRSDNGIGRREKQEKRLKDGVVFIHIISEATDVSRFGGKILELYSSFLFSVHSLRSHQMI